MESRGESRLPGGNGTKLVLDGWMRFRGDDGQGRDLQGRQTIGRVLET